MERMSCYESSKGAETTQAGVIFLRTAECALRKPKPKEAKSKYRRRFPSGMTAKKLEGEGSL